jgi:protein phosphatase 2C-like protein
MSELWKALGRSVRGAAHLRRGKPNQDAIGWRLEPAVTLAVADGHGSEESFRSATGAALAVEVALDVLASNNDVEALPALLVERWRAAVREDLERNPLPDRDEFLTYGSTILAAMATHEFVLYVQLGDGDILAVSEHGEVTRPLGKDARLLGLETTSLCGARAAADVRVRLEPICKCAPALVLLCTDGYANSFREDRGFLNVGSDLLEMIRANGLGYVDRNLMAWLTEASELGSGDDITLGLLCREAVHD